MKKDKFMNVVKIVTIPMVLAAYVMTSGCSDDSAIVKLNSQMAAQKDKSSSAKAKNVDIASGVRQVGEFNQYKIGDYQINVYPDGNYEASYHYVSGADLACVSGHLISTRYNGGSVDLNEKCDLNSFLGVSGLKEKIEDVNKIKLKEGYSSESPRHK